LANPRGTEASQGVHVRRTGSTAPNGSWRRCLIPAACTVPVDAAVSLRREPARYDIAPPELAESASRRSRNLADTAEDAASIQRLQLLASHLVDPLLLDSVEVLHESPHGLLDDLQRFLDLRESPKCIVRDGDLAQAFDL
jgi:hypothetical protein